MDITLVLINLPAQDKDRPAFYLSDTEITIKQFRRFMQDTPGFQTTAERKGSSSCFGHDGQTGSWHPCEGATWQNISALPMGPAAADDLPVVHVSWNDAIQFCNWLSRKEGLDPAYQQGSNGVWTLLARSNGYRLPSLAEWEIASRAATSTPFWWADYQEWQDDAKWKCLVANLPDATFARWTYINGIRGDDGYPFQAPVRTFAPNDWGIFEIIGNVGEWCNGEGVGNDKPRMGGSWGDNLQAVTTTSRRNEGADSSHVNVGFRIARSLLP